MCCPHRDTEEVYGGTVCKECGEFINKEEPMNKNITQILNDAHRFRKGAGSILLYNGYKRKIDRAIAPEGQKKVACLELAHIMGVKPC